MRLASSDFSFARIADFQLAFLPFKNVDGQMKRIAGISLLAILVSGCAIEGIGVDGHTLAYQNAEAASREYVSLHRGDRDSSWYANWCASIRPHLARMQDESARLDRYCKAMQDQPVQAANIAHDLAEYLNDAANTAARRSDADRSALAAFSATQQSTAKPVHCASQSFGAQTYTNCN
jgi:hypothetical protein